MVTRAALGFVALLWCVPAVALAQNATAPPGPTRDSRVDVTAGAAMVRDSDQHAFAGLRGTVALNVTESIAAIVQGDWLIAIAERSSSGRIIRDHQTTALAGIRVRRFFESPAVLYLQISAGSVSRKDNGLLTRRTSFAFRTDGGLEAALSRHLGFRAGGGWTSLFADVPYRNQFGGTIALTVFLGTR